MTEPITETPVSPSEINAEPQTEAPVGTDNTGDIPDAPRGSAEAAKYRVRAREAEAERDALAQRVEAMQSRELERLAGKHLSAPEDLLTLSAKQLGDFISASGDVDPELVAKVAAEVLASRPGLRPNQPAYDRTQGLGGNTPTKRTPTWTDLLQP